MTGYSVGEVAEAAGVTVRTLHHYDQIGLLEPGGRSRSGYRLYRPEDLERLQRIVFYRELGFPLREIGELLDETRVDAAAHLRRQHRLLRRRIERLQGMVAAVELEMEALRMGYQLGPEERMELFGDFVPEDHDQEAAERWGETDAYRESQRRARAYTAEDWRQIKRETDILNRNLQAAVERRIAPDSQEGMDLAEEHRRQISRWFYELGPQSHVGLTQMGVDDPRFRRHYEAIAEGLAEFLRDAALANAARSET